MTDWLPGHPKPILEDYVTKDLTGNYGVYGVTRDGRFINNGPYLPLLELDSEDVTQLTKDSPFTFKSYEWEDIIRNRVLIDQRYAVGKAEGATPLWYPKFPPAHAKFIWVPPLAFVMGYFVGTVKGLVDIFFRWDVLPVYRIPFLSKQMEKSRKWTYMRGCWRIYPRKMFLLSFKWMIFSSFGWAISGNPEFGYWLPFVGLASFAGFPRQSWPKLMSNVTVGALAGLGFIYARRLTHHAEPSILDFNTWKNPHLKYPYPPATDVLDRHVFGALAAEKLNRNLDNYINYKQPPADPLKLPHVQRVQ